MNYEFLISFTPKIIDVVKRDQPFWETFQYVLERDRTLLHVMAYVYSGQGILELDGKRTPLASGCTFQVPPGKAMRITTTPDHTLCFYSIHCRYGMAHWEGTELRLAPSEGALPLPETQLWPENNGLADKFQQAFTLWKNKNSGYEWQVRQLLIDMLQSFLQGKLPAGEISSAGSVQEAIDFMKTSYKEELTRERMAERLSLSPGYFSILFKKHTGLSPIHYLNRIRMDQAKHLLKNTRYPIKQVAEEVGFQDSFYFSRMFVKETGMAPSDYRKS
ncbi:AraC family transcriptional regulator [Paenibacillus qinlingensis]|uniref:AraC-like DNA-binding protein n=1 Tax=Paenibacillus qinlingensis TaxID=1837343 RepID=A0ABU1P6I0_9BACL|nr:AraC family transcriptional regulator [Paenibacillus qinlingensis]MDR6555357.1 AraC-like DNA-binding protein [Paenibacillus qinlingensis]